MKALVPAVRAAASDFDVVVVAASLGGIDALRTILGALSPRFPVPIAIALHRNSRCSFAAAIVDAATRLQVRDGRHGAMLRPGNVWLAPPGRHLTIERRSGIIKLGLSNAPQVNFARPSADVLFSSAARTLGARVLAITLTGLLNDGARGAAAIRAAGGLTLVQDPESARARGMPDAVIRQGSANFVLPLERIAPALELLVQRCGLRSVLGVSAPIVAAGV